MGHYICFRSTDDDDGELHLTEYAELCDILLLAAGYNCPCGTSQREFPTPTEEQRKFGWPDRPPEEPLMLLYYPDKRPPPENETDDERDCRECCLWGWIEAKDCLLIADRIDGLLGNVEKIAPRKLKTMQWMANAFRKTGEAERCATWP